MVVCCKTLETNVSAAQSATGLFNLNYVKLTKEI
jgi:hypothetical protein